VVVAQLVDRTHPTAEVRGSGRPHIIILAALKRQKQRKMH